MLQPHGGRIIARVIIEGCVVAATVDTEATRSFIGSWIVKKLGNASNRCKVKTVVALAYGNRKELTQTLWVDVQLGSSCTKVQMLELPIVLDDVLLDLDILGAINAVLICGGVSLHLGTRAASHVPSRELAATLDFYYSTKKTLDSQDNTKNTSRTA